MAASRWRPGIALLLLAGISCGDDGESGPEPAEITGAWTATKIEYTATSGSGAVDFVALGGTASLQLNQDGSYVFTLTPAGAAPQTTADDWELESDGTLTLHLGPNGEWQFDTQLTGDTLQLDGADTEYDFDGDEVRDPAKMHWTFSR